MKLLPSFLKLTAIFFLNFWICGHSFLKAQTENSLFGITRTGGIENKGTIFHVDATTGTQIVDYSLTYNKGQYPLGNLTDGGNGKFYGLTSYGGFNDEGVIFEWDPISNIYTKKFDFNGETGRHPNGSLVLRNGMLFGIAEDIIFKWDPVTNTCTKLFDLVASTIGIGSMEMTLYGDKFYGATNQGGINNSGVIFEFDPVTNTCIKKIEMPLLDYDHPAAFYNTGLTPYNGKFYGMSIAGGKYNVGTIFEWDPVTNILTKKIDFESYGEGSLTLFNGKFYGFMAGMDSYGIYGGIFEWDPETNTYTLKVTFDRSQGSTPSQRLALKDGKFYGVTLLGGVNDAGTIFEWNPVTNSLIKKVDFDKMNEYPSSGSPSRGSLTFSNGKFYGMNKCGGVNDNGAIFEWDPVSNVYTKKIDFDITNKGNGPQGSLTLFKGKFYGLTIGGGAHDGVIFEFDPVLKSYTKKIDLDGSTYWDGTTLTNIGGNPYGSLTLCNGKFYGMTLTGGLNGYGVLFEWDCNTNTYSKKVDFDLTNGGDPYGSLTVSGGKLYGMTKSGGAYNLGVLFEFDPLSNTYTKKIDFDGSNNGSSPYGSLTLYQDKLYGMATYGGVNGCGVIFVYDPATSTYTKKKDFDFINGSAPYGSFTQYNGKMYGLTYAGGASQEGVIFEWDPISNILIKKLDFDGPERGNKPDGSLTFLDGMFFGMTHYGGTNNLGVAFKWNPNTNNFTKLLDFNGVNGSNPVYPQFSVFTTQASSITFSDIQTNQVTFDWIDGTGSKRAVFVNRNSEGSPSPVDNSTYSANTSFGSGSQIGTSGWYCVFNGTTHSSGITVTNLIPNTTYRVMVCEYDGNSGIEQYKAITTIGNPQNQTTLHDLTTSVPNLSTVGKFKIYPNPTNGLLKIESQGDLSDKTMIEIYDLYGKLIFSKYFENIKDQTVDVSRFSKGIYFLRIKCTSTIYTGKLVIN